MYTKIFSTFVISLFLSVLSIYFSKFIYFLKETSKDFEDILKKKILF